MLVPPFTIMIIKHSRRPITIRVTYTFLLAVLCLLALVSIAAVSVIQSFIIPSLSGLSDAPTGEKTVTQYVIAESNHNDSDETASALSSQPDITDLTITESRNGEIELSFAVAQYSQKSDLLFWLILNPNPGDSRETAIIPRNPLFGGMPVDYRNGIRYLPEKEKKLSFMFSGAGVDQLRILAYSTDGDIVIDKMVAF